MRTLTWLLLPIGLALFIAACSSQGAGFDISISGAVNRDLSGAAIYYEGIPTGKQLYMEKHGSGGDIQVLTIELPADVAPGTYPIGTVSSSESISAAYFEFVGGVSSQFERNVSGIMSIEGVESAFNGKIDFYATAPFSQASIHVVGDFRNIPYGAEGTDAGIVTTTLFTCGFVMLLLINLVLQFFVGSKVYAVEGGGILRSLRGTRTFIRGWQVPEIRSIMLIWTILLIFLILVLLIAGAMAVSNLG